MRWRWVALGGLAVAGLLGFLLLRPRNPLPPPLLLRAGTAEAWPGIEERQRNGLLALIQDALEIGADRTGLTELPQRSHSGIFPLEVLELSAHRSGQDLCIQGTRIQPDGARTSFQHQAPPIQTFTWLLDFLKQPQAPLKALLPSTPEDFWALIGQMEPADRLQLSAQIAEARALVQRQPDCASARFALAHLSLRQINAEVPTDPEPQTSCEAGFREALRILPGYPRASCQLVRLKVDTGAAREALDLAFRLLEVHPRNASAFGSVAYAARNSGLLEGALATLRAREELCGGSLADPGLSENAYLYSGDLERFQLTLGSGSTSPQSAVRDFYRGYIRLLQGDPSSARVFFHNAACQPGADSQFVKLAGVYDLALQGRSKAALASLEELRTNRASLRVPDGEFTFKLAEAYAFLDLREPAMDMAFRAFGQGFGCTRWYRESPLLRNLQDLPRWRNLLQHLQERQDLIALAFPPERFHRP